MKYDIYFGHGLNYSMYADQLEDKVKKIHYRTGSSITAFNKQSEDRYNRYYSRNDIHSDTTGFRRVCRDNITTANTDYLIGLGEMTCSSFASYEIPITVINNAAYTPSVCMIQRGTNIKSDISNKFIYLSGTNGNIQKGADILIEAFAGLKDQHLYIYCRLEDERLGHSTFQKH